MAVSSWELDRWVCIFTLLLKLRVLNNLHLLLPWASFRWDLCLATQSCLTLCDPLDCSPPGSSVHGTLQARTLQWVAILSSRGSSQPRDWAQVSCLLHCRQILYYSGEKGKGKLREALRWDLGVGNFPRWSSIQGLLLTSLNCLWFVCCGPEVDRSI